RVCYGVADRDMVSVMGSGMELRLENAYPWRESLRYFALDDLAAAALNPLSVLFGRVSLAAPVASLTSVWSAKMKRHYPRTEAEMKAGKDIILRPARPL